MVVSTTKIGPAPRRDRIAFLAKFLKSFDPLDVLDALRKNEIDHTKYVWVSPNLLFDEKIKAMTSREFMSKYRAAAKGKQNELSRYVRPGTPDPPADDPQPE